MNNIISHKWEDLNVEIVNQDSLFFMKTLPDEHIDMVITSPPYDDIRNYNGYSFPFEDMAKELFRVLKQGGVIIWVVADATRSGSETGTSFKQALFFESIGARIHDTMIYAKNNPMPTGGKRYQQSFEYMFCFSKGTPKTFNPIMVKSKYKGTASMNNRGEDGTIDYTEVERTEFHKVSNIFYYSIGGGITTKDKMAFEHPAIFPEKLADDQINTWSNENDLIYDPFLGSGTTAKMAMLSKRHFIGSEIAPEYIDISRRRLEETYNKNVSRLINFN